MSAKVELNDVSIKFRKYSAHGSGLKETIMGFLSGRHWKQKGHPTTQSFMGLDGINLHIKEGDRLGIVGKNGAGKSTLLKIITRVYRPTSGEVMVDGRIAALIEVGAGFNPELSGRDNIFLNGAILGIPKKELAQKVDSIVDFAELRDFIDMPVKYYSTGMALRLAFTIATEITPNILILDELYAGGDASFIERANVRLRSFVDKSQILITVAHNTEYIVQFCNKVIVLDHGRIIATGAPREMCDKYQRFCLGESEIFKN